MTKTPKKIQSSLKCLKMVFSEKKYFLITVVIAFLFYSLNASVGNISLIFNSYSSLGFFRVIAFYFTLVFGYVSTIKLTSFITLIVISILFGVLFSLVIYKAVILKSTQKSKLGFVTSIGIFLGVAAPGCAACGIGLLPLLGVSAAGLSFLPFQGIELSFAAIAILIFSIVQFSNKLITCEIRK